MFLNKPNPQLWFVAQKHCLFGGLKVFEAVGLNFPFFGEIVELENCWSTDVCFEKFAGFDHFGALENRFGTDFGSLKGNVDYFGYSDYSDYFDCSCSNFFACCAYLIDLTPNSV